ncbi:MAG: hypothetical protein ACP5IZ_11530, partial [Thermoprotei archaeon]
MVLDKHYNVVVSIVFSMIIILFFAAILNMFMLSKVPSVKVNNVYWNLGVGGYELVVDFFASDHVQLLGVDVDGAFKSMVYDIPLGNSTVAIPLGVKGSKVVFYFSSGSPLVVYPKDLSPTATKLGVLYGDDYLFLYGVLLDRATVFVLPVTNVGKTLIIVDPDEYSIFMNEISQLHIQAVDVVSANMLRKTMINNYTTLFFVDVFPLPDDLNVFVKSGKVVILNAVKKMLGEKRIVFRDENASVISVSPDQSDVDYLGSHCMVPVAKRDVATENNILANILQIYPSSAEHGVIPSSYCKNLFESIYAVSGSNEIVFGKTLKGYYINTMYLKPLYPLIQAGFFEKKSNIEIKEIDLTPFKGFKPITSISENKYLVTIITKNIIIRDIAERPPIEYASLGEKILLSINENKSTAKVRIEQYSYSLDLISVIINTATPIPTNIQFNFSRLSTYMLYINNTPSLLIADENILKKTPSITLEYSTICELFALKIQRLDNIQSDILLSINGKTQILGPNGKYEQQKCTTGKYMITVYDVYGNELKTYNFEVIHFYQNPLFIAGIFAIATTVISIIVHNRRREMARTTKNVQIILYSLPETQDKITPEEIILHVKNITTSKKTAPT